ncbi:MAG: helix-turn-helix domain-containing protein [Tepidisphaeraceae bacterium]
MDTTHIPHEPLAGSSQVLLLRPREASAALGISERTLWSLAERGEIPRVRIGRAVAYSVDSLREFIRGREQEGGRP